MLKAAVVVSDFGVHLILIRWRVSSLSMKLTLPSRSLLGLQLDSMDDAIPSEVYLQLLRLSIKPSDSLVGSLANTGGVPQDEHIRKIIAAILWHREFIVTYYAWFVVAILVCTGRNIYKRYKYKKRAENINGCKNAGSRLTSVASSSSSTLTGTSTPPQKDDNADISETTHLLPQEDFVSRAERPSLWQKVSSRLICQPAPIPALTSPINTLPDNGTTLLILVLLGLNLFYLLYRTPLSLPWIFILSDRAGLLFVANLPVLYILAAKNNQPIKYLIGCSYEGLNIFHRRLGEWMTCFAVIHMVGMLVVWYFVLRPLGFTIIKYLTAPIVILGICTVLSYYIIYLTSVGWFRHLYYETFLGLHIFFQFAALIFLFFHYPTARPYVGVALAIWVIDRGIWRIATSSRKFIATLEVAPDGQTILLHSDISLNQERRFLGIPHSLHHGWAPGQHLFLTIPSMGFKYRFQAHPFTIASPAPPENLTTDESWPLQLTIRAIDGFSRDLLHYARLHQHCEVILDGPYGSTSALEEAHATDRVCFVAGGSGIAVTYPLAWDVRIKPNQSVGSIVSTRTLYVDGVRKSPPTTVESSSLVGKTKYAHFWVRQDERHRSWVTMLLRANAVKQCYVDSSNTAPTKSEGDKEVTNLITRAFDTRNPGPDGGRPDMKSEIWSWVTLDAPSNSGLLSSTLLASSNSPQQAIKPYDTRKEKICIIVSGPDGLVRDVRNVVADLVLQGWNVDVHVEKFGW